MKNVTFKATNYPNDVTDEEWGKIRGLLPSGNKNMYPKCSLVRAVYIEKIGFQWLRLLHDYSPYSTIQSFFYLAQERDIWEKTTDTLVHMIHEKKGCKSPPTNRMIDSQSVNAVAASEKHSIDEGKAVKGRTCHIVVAITGNVLAAVVHATNVRDTKSGIEPAKKAFEKYLTIEKFCDSVGYHNSFVQDVMPQLGLGVDISKRIALVCAVIQKRWVVKRIFARMNNSCKLCRGYEITMNSKEAVMFISHLRTSLLRGICL
jgi:transposase